MFPICSYCDKPVKYEADIRCSTCETVFHASCAVSDRDSDSGAAAAAWICDACNVAAVQPADDPKAIQFSSEAPPVQGLPEAGALNISHFNMIMSQFTSLNSAVDNCRAGIFNSNKLLAEQGQQISSCIGEIKNLKQENADLRLKITNLEDKLQAVDIGSLYAETRSRIQREPNIMLFGVPESHSTDDQHIVQKILESVTDASFDGIQSVARVGKQRPDSTRPIKVELTNPRIRALVLRQKGCLKKSIYQHVTINPDLTQKQLKHLRDLREELTHRKASGEKNIGIRYINSEPVIVQLRSPQSADALSLPENGSTASNKRIREESRSPREPNKIKFPHTPGTGRGNSK